MRAHSRPFLFFLAGIRPLVHISRCENGKAMKAAAGFTSYQLIAVENAVTMRPFQIIF